MQMGQSIDRGGHQGSAGGLRHQDAATGHAGAGAGDGYSPDAVAGRGAGTQRQRKSTGTFGFGLNFQAIIYGLEIGKV